VTKALLLAYHFPPGGGGGVQRVAKFVRYLPEHGYVVTVVTGTGTADDLWTPQDGTLVAGIPPETRVHRVPGPEPRLDVGGWRRRAARVLARPSPFTRWWVDGAAGLGCAVGGDADVVVCELVPYESAEAAVRIARALGKPWVADLQDPWALDEMWLYPTGLHRRRDLARMRALLGTAAAVVVNTREALLRFRRRFPELATRLYAIPNGFDAEDFARPLRPRTDDAFRIVHTGTMHTELGLQHRRSRRARELLGGTPVRGVDFLTRSHVFLLEALEIVFAREPELRRKVEVHLAGALTAADRAATAGAGHVQARGYLPHEETLDLARGADLLFLPMHDLPTGVRAGLVPGKAYEYLASGRPILAAVPAGDARDLILAAGTGLVCAPSDVAAMAEIVHGAIRRWRSGEAGPQLCHEVIEPYERRNLTRELAHVLDGALRRGHEPVPALAGRR
jgi:glycosyltransferase involved in cell wall biosynthesis